VESSNKLFPFFRGPRVSERADVPAHRESPKERRAGDPKANAIFPAEHAEQPKRNAPVLCERNELLEKEKVKKQK